MLKTSDKPKASKLPAQEKTIDSCVDLCQKVQSIMQQEIQKTQYTLNDNTPISQKQGPVLQLTSLIQHANDQLEKLKQAITAFASKKKSNVIKTDSHVVKIPKPHATSKDLNNLIIALNNLESTAKTLKGLSYSDISQGIVLHTETQLTALCKKLENATNPQVKHSSKTSKPTNK